MIDQLFDSGFVPESGHEFVRVLIAEDFAAWRHFVLEKLQENPHLRVVGVATDGLAAVQKAEGLRPDLIVLAIGLPQLNGIEVAKQIRKCAPECKIIFLTLETSADMVQLALGLGAQGFVSKVSAESDLLAAVDAVTSGKKFVSQNLGER
ncbi:MAG: response regulator transcription factor [Candidatus Acidiferrales bacterium]